jgi:hypothetical protein
MFKKGDPVVQILPAPRRGIVIGFDICQETGERILRVDETVEGGEETIQYFLESALALDTTEP